MSSSQYVSVLGQQYRRRASPLTSFLSCSFRISDCMLRFSSFSRQSARGARAGVAGLHGPGLEVGLSFSLVLGVTDGLTASRRSGCTAIRGRRGAHC